MLEQGTMSILGMTAEPESFLLILCRLKVDRYAVSTEARGERVSGMCRPLSSDEPFVNVQNARDLGVSLS